MRAWVNLIVITMACCGLHVVPPPVPVPPDTDVCSTPECVCDHLCEIGCVCDPLCAPTLRQIIEDRVMYIDVECIMASHSIEAVRPCMGVACVE